MLLLMLLVLHVHVTHLLLLIVSPGAMLWGVGLDWRKQADLILRIPDWFLIIRAQLGAESLLGVRDAGVGVLSHQMLIELDVPTGCDLVDDSRGVLHSTSGADELISAIAQVAPLVAGPVPVLNVVITDRDQSVCRRRRR
jgi:hypothetical protein